MVATLNQVENFISVLMQYDIQNSPTSYSLIKNSFFALTIPYPVIPLKAGTRFVRCRLHLNNEMFFYKIDEISHRKDVLNIETFGRANEPIQSIFYASDKQEISFIEASNIIKTTIHFLLKLLQWASGKFKNQLKQLLY